MLFRSLRFARLRGDRALIERARELAHQLLDEEGPWHQTAEGLLGDIDPSGLA